MQSTLQQIWPPNQWGDRNLRDGFIFRWVNGSSFFHSISCGISVKVDRSWFSLERSPFVEWISGFTQAVSFESCSLMASYHNRNHSTRRWISSVLLGRGLIALYDTLKTTLKDFIIESKEQRIWVDTKETNGSLTLALISCKILRYQPAASTHLGYRKWKVLCPTESRGMIGSYVGITCLNFLWGLEESVLILLVLKAMLFSVFVYFGQIWRI